MRWLIGANVVVVVMRCVFICKSKKQGSIQEPTWTTKAKDGRHCSTRQGGERARREGAELSHANVVWPSKQQHAMQGYSVKQERCEKSAEMNIRPTASSPVRGREGSVVLCLHYSSLFPSQLSSPPQTLRGRTKTGQRRDEKQCHHPSSALPFHEIVRTLIETVSPS